MSAEEVRAKVVEQVRARMIDEDMPITDESLLESDLALDLLDTVELIMDIEEELDIHFDEEAMDGMKTGGDVVKAAVEAAGKKEERSEH